MIVIPIIHFNNKENLEYTTLERSTSIVVVISKGGKRYSVPISSIAFIELPDDIKMD